MYTPLSSLNFTFFIYRMNVIPTSQGCWKRLVGYSTLYIVYQFWGWSPEPRPGSVVYWQNSQDSALILLTAVMYYSKRLQSKVSRGKRLMRPSLEESRQLPTVLSRWSPAGCASFLQQWVVYHGSLFRTQCPGPHGHPLPSTSPNFRLPEGKQVFSVNCIS